MVGLTSGAITDGNLMYIMETSIIARSASLLLKSPFITGGSFKDCFIFTPVEIIQVD